MNAQADSALELAAKLEQAGKIEESEASYRRFIDEQPSHAVARFNLACFLRRRGRLEEALEEHQSALDLQIDHPEEVLSNMAVIQTELRRDAAAKLLFERALAVNPNYIPAMFNLALQHEEFGDRKTAVSIFGKILDLNPAWHDALIRIAHAVTDPRAGRAGHPQAPARAPLLECRRADPGEPAFRIGQGARRLRAV